MQPAKCVCDILNTIDLFYNLAQANPQPTNTTNGHYDINASGQPEKLKSC